MKIEDLTADQQVIFKDMVSRGVAEYSDFAIIDYVREHGREFIPAALPADLDHGDMGACFDNAIIRSLYVAGGKYRYVEGAAQSHADGLWRLHAWLTDGTHAFEVTWFVGKGKKEDRRIINIPYPAKYIGIEMDATRVAKFMLATEYAGVLANAHRSPNIARKAYQSVMNIPRLP